MKSKFKVGDIVFVRDSYEEDSDSDDYPYGFPIEMLQLFGGKKVRIKKVTHKYGMHELNSDRKLYSEPYVYDLEDLNGENVGFGWYFCEAMLKSNLPTIF